MTACFQDLGTRPLLAEMLTILQRTGEISIAKCLMNQNSILSYHPGEVWLALQSKVAI